MCFIWRIYSLIIISKKGSHIDGLHEDVCEIVQQCKAETTKIKIITVLNCLLLTYNNKALKNLLLKNGNYILY